MDKIRSLRYVNASGQEVILSDPSITKWFELRGRSGFTAPQIDLVTQKYANGTTKILKRQLQPRTVTVSMIVIGDSNVERDAVFFEMVDRLMDMKGGEIGKLYVKRSDGMVVYLNCVYSSGLSILEEYNDFHRFTLEFYAPDAWFYKDLDDLTISAHANSFLTLGDNLLIGSYHKMGEFTSVGDGVIHNTSSEILQPVIRLHNVRGTVSITNEASGETISMINMNMMNGQTLIIDTRDESKNIYIENVDGSKTGAGQNLEWSNSDNNFPILPGDNSISYNGSAGSRIEYLTFSMAERYLSA